MSTRLLLELVLRVSAAIALVYLTLVFVECVTAPPASVRITVTCSAAEWDTCA
jgi:hypothetical protein